MSNLAVTKPANIIRLIFGVAWLYLFILGLHAYQGNGIVYIVFSTTFLLMLVSAFYGRRTYVYTYLVVFFWLGFWLKVTYHLVFPYPYVEPTGRFVSSAASWNKVLLVSTVACVGTLVSRLIFQVVPGGQCSTGDNGKNIPHWLQSSANWQLLLFILAVLITSVANIYFGIFVIGFDVRTILAWPLNALITLMLVGGGFVVWASSILWWRSNSGRPLFAYLVTLVVLGEIMTSLALSRGLIVFFVLPLLYALYENRQKIADYSAPKTILIGLFFLFFVIVNFFVVNEIRDNVYFSRNDQHIQHQAEPQLPISEKIRSFLNFSVDRWVGIEGVMAVSSYSKTGSELFLRALYEKPGNGRLTIYQTICPWPSSPEFSSLKKDVRLFSLPGGVAFLYYSNSIVVVFVFTVLISFFLQYAESLIFSFVGNPILCSGVGWLMAITFAQFGGVPRTLVPVIIFLLFSILFVGVIQARRTEGLWRKIALSF